ncbi:RnfABCDGE type electron transport complex subunit D [Megalodesulfovibrio paquesii]
MAHAELAKSFLTAKSAPFWHCGRTVKGMMTDTLIALAPAMIMAVVHYGYHAVETLAWAGLAAVLAEALAQKLMGREYTADDYTALVGGLLFAFLLPATAPGWLVFIGSALSILLGRMVFGGYGMSPVCAPAVGWCVMTISWPDLVDLNGMLLLWDRVEPLSELKYFGVDAIANISLPSLLFGSNLGALGASQTLAVLAGGVYLILRGQLRWHIPVSFLLGVFLTALLYNLIDPQLYAPPLFHLCSGGVMLAAFFLMPYPSSSPVWPAAMLLYGLFGGAVLVIIRTYGIYPDGAAFAVLLANLFTPLFDLIQPKPFGGR